MCIHWTDSRGILLVVVEYMLPSYKNCPGFCRIGIEGLDGLIGNCCNLFSLKQIRDPKKSYLSLLPEKE
jgi:hypothetical protein